MRRITTVTIAALAAALALTAAGSPANAGGGCHSEVFRDEATTQVDLSNNCFQPTVVRVQPGDTVTWNNSDTVVHTVTGVANTWGDDKDVLGGGSVSYQFAEAGVFPYFCYFHPSMVGAVVVGDGSAAGAGAANDSVKAVSAQVPGGEAGAADEDAITETDGRDTTVPLVMGVGVLAAIGGFAGALVMRRRSAAAD